MPSRSTSSASARAKAFIPALDAEYAVLPGMGSCDAEDDTNTKRDPGTINGRASEATTKQESRLAAIVVRHCSMLCLRA